MARFCLIFLVLAGIFVVQTMAEEPELNPVEVNPQNEVLSADHYVTVAAEPSHSMEESELAEGPAIRKLGKGSNSKHHTDKSVAGGGVIIGGLVAAIFAAVFCYIRVTRKRGGVY